MSDNSNFKELRYRSYCFMLLVLIAFNASGKERSDFEETDRTKPNETVVLLHGLARSSSSMKKMSQALIEAGYAVCNIGYPSTEHTMSILVEEHIAPSIKQCIEQSNDTTTNALPQQINFVTHSMGGIAVRYLAEYFGDRGSLPEIGRVVMLSPPNKGSEVVDKLGRFWLFDLLNGPAGQELGTDPDGVPLTLGPANFELGIITGRRSINLFLSLLIKGRDDGKVSIENAKLQGMTDFLVLPASHPFIMKNDQAISQAIYFLKEGVFLELEN